MPSFINPSSKTFWTGLGGVGYGIYTLVTGDTDTGIKMIFAGLGLIFMRDAVEKSGPNSGGTALVLFVLGSLLFASSSFAQDTPTNTPTFTQTPTSTRTFTKTPTPTQTPTSTVTRTPTLTPAADSKNAASHFNAVELTLYNADYDLPAYSALCVGSSYAPSDPDACRCVLYVKRVSGSNTLNMRCPDGDVVVVAP